MKKFLSLVLALVMTMSLVTIGAGATEYKDLTDKSEIQYEEAVAVLNKIGIITGYEDGSFKPTGALTRGAAAKIIVSLMIGSEAASNLTVTAAPYSDVPVTNTFAGVISYCKTAGYINGYADGTFRPTAPLTGYAFTKMLLGALGYDGKIEGFTGSGWTMNVAKLGNKAGLFNDFATAFKGNAGLTREEACLLALNTLKATEVEYAGTDVSVKGDNIDVTVGNTQYSYVTSNNTKINKNIKVGDGAGLGNNYYTLEFGEEHFQDLKLTADGTATDDFGRPSNEWSYKNAKIGTYAQTADFVYTTEANGDTDADKVKDMGLKNYKVAENFYYVNGKAVEFKATKDAGKLEEIAALTANGLKVEAFMDDHNADTISSFVLIYTQIMQINAVRSSEVTLKSVEDKYLDGAGTVTAVKDDDDAWNSVKGLKTDDYVMVVPVKDGSSYRAFSVTVPQTVTGSLTNIKVKTANTGDKISGVTVAGTAYKMSKLWTSKDKELTATTKLSSSVETTIYLDTYGYVLFAKDVTSSNSAIIVDEIYSSLVNGKIVKYAKGWDSKGNAIELNLGTSPNLGVYNETTIQGHVFEYATDTANNAEYKLIAPYTGAISKKNIVYATGGLAGSQPVAPGTYSMAINAAGDKLPFDSAVKFIFISTENGVGTDVTGITVKSGVSEILASSKATLTFITNKDATKIVTVVVDNDEDAGNTANLLYFQKVTNHVNNADGKRVAIFTAYVNGEKLTDLQLNKDIDGDGYNDKFYTYSKDESTGVYSLTSYAKTNKITSVAHGVAVADADLTSVQNYYIKSGSDYLNASNATVIDLFSDDGITFGTVKEMKDAINEGRASDFKVSYIYNGDSGNSGYLTVSYLFITENKWSGSSSNTQLSTTADFKGVTDVVNDVIAGNTMNYYVEASADATLLEKQNAITNALTKAGATNISWDASNNVNFTYGGSTRTGNDPVSHMQRVYKLTVDNKDPKYLAVGATELVAGDGLGYTAKVGTAAPVYAAYGAGTYTMTAGDTVITTGYVTVATPTSPAGGSPTDALTSTVALVDSTLTYVKVGDSFKVKVTINRIAVPTKDVTVTLTATGSTYVDAATDVTKAELTGADGAVELTFTVKAGTVAVDPISATIADK